MKNNLIPWANHYEDIFLNYYHQFCLFLESYNEPIISYNEFVVFCYRNTQKNYLHLPGIYGKQLHAPLI